MTAKTMKQKRSRMDLLVTIAAAACMAALTSLAGVTYSLDGGTLTVRATSSLGGARLHLLWDEVDRGDTVAAWANSTNFVSVVPSGGGTFAVDLDALGIANGTPCRIAAIISYSRLDMLKMESTECYIDTGIHGTNCYGVCLGFYGTGISRAFGAFIGSGNDNGASVIRNHGGFQLAANNTDETRWMWIYRGGKTNGNSNRPSISTNFINEVAFTNGVFMVNGTAFRTNLEKSAISTNAIYNMNIGRSAHAADQVMYGWWSHVSLYGEDGNKMLDYVPVQRADGKVGFWDRVTEKFVTSSGTGEFVAGTQTGETMEVEAREVVARTAFVPNRSLGLSADKSLLTVTVPSGLAGERLMVLWDDEDKGDDIAAWANQTVLAESIDAESYTVRLGPLGVKHGQTCRVVAANRFNLLDMLQMTSKQCYIDTGIHGTDCYGVRLGFYGTGISKAYGAFIGCGNDNEASVIQNRGGFQLAANETDETRWRWMYRGEKLNGDSNRPSVSTNSINEIAFTNGVFMVNGTAFRSNLAKGSISTNAIYNMNIGRSAHDANLVMYGWWSHVSLDDEGGNRIRDYIPAQRVADGKVGFYDRATKSFVTSSGTGNFTAGTVTNAAPVAAVNSSSSTFVANIPGLIISLQ